MSIYLHIAYDRLQATGAELTNGNRAIWLTNSKILLVPYRRSLLSPDKDEVHFTGLLSFPDSLPHFFTLLTGLISQVQVLWLAFGRIRTKTLC